MRKTIVRIFTIIGGLQSDDQEGKKEEGKKKKKEERNDKERRKGEMGEGEKEDKVLVSWLILFVSDDRKS